MRRYLEVGWGRGDAQAVAEGVVAEYHDHDAPPGIGADRAGLLAVLARFAAAFPDAEVTPAVLIAEEDLVGVRWTMRATQRGEFFGIAARGQAVTLKGMDLYRIRAGQIVEGWHVEDILGLWRQIGATVPPVPGGDAPCAGAE